MFWLLIGSRTTSESVERCVSKFDRSEFAALPAALAELLPAAVDCAELALDAGAMTGIDMANLEGLSSSNSVRSRLIEDMVGIRVDANCVLVPVADVPCLVPLPWLVWDCCCLLVSALVVNDFWVLEASVDE